MDDMRTDMTSHQDKSDVGALKLANRAAWVFAFFLCLYGLSMPSSVQPGDPMVIYATARNLVTQGTLAVEPGPEYYPGEHENTVQAPNGRYYAIWGLTQVLIEAPLVLVDRALQPFFKEDRDKRAVWTFIMQLLPALVMSMACTMFFLIVLEMGASPRASFLLTLVLGLATTIWPYSQCLQTETTQTAFLLLAVLCAMHYRRTRARSTALILGIIFGLQLNLKLTTVLFWPALVIYMWRSRDELRCRLRDILALAPGLICGVLVFMWHAHLRYGSPIALGFAGGRNCFGFDVPLASGLWGYLFSPNRSIFVYSPVLLLSVIGCRLFLRRFRAEACLIAGIAMPWLLLHAKWHDFPGGWAWGARFLVPLVPMLFLPGAMLLLRWTRFGRASRIIVVVILAVSVFVQVLGIMVDPFDYIREVSLVEQAVVPHVRGMEHDYKQWRVKKGAYFWGAGMCQVAGQWWVLKHAVLGEDPWDDFPPRSSFTPLNRTVPADREFRLSPWTLVRPPVSPLLTWMMRFIQLLLVLTGLYAAAFSTGVLPRGGGARREQDP